MAIYTRTGDQGQTDLLGGTRAPKDSPRLEVCGDLDELDALLGLARCEPLPEGATEVLDAPTRSAPRTLSGSNGPSTATTPSSNR